MAWRQKTAYLHKVVTQLLLSRIPLLIFPIQSADGTLSVIDVRANKPEPLARSEDQEDELLSIVAIRR